MHTLYGSRGSGSAAIEVALRRCGLPYQVLRASTWEPDSDQAALARVNPLGRIPALVAPDGRVMTESAAILIDLGLRHPASGLLPDEPDARAQAVRALVYVAANCYAAISVVDYPERWTTAGTKPAQERVRVAARQQLHRAWEVFADSFTGEPFLAGAQQPGAADILASVVSRWSGARPHLAQARPACHAWLQRVDAAPVAAEVFAAHWPG